MLCTDTAITSCGPNGAIKIPVIVSARKIAATRTRRVTGVQDPLGNTWTYTYDWLGNRTGVNDPDLGAWSYSFDVASRLVSQTDAQGQSTTLTYDALGRVLSKMVNPATPGSQPNEVTDFIYDQPRSGFHNLGKLTTARRTVATQSVGGFALKAVDVTREYDHDLAGRLAHEKHRILKDGTTFIEKHTSTAYWPDGSVKRKTLADGFVTGLYLYDAVGRLSGIDNDAVASSTEPLDFISAIQYNARGQTSSITYGDGTTTAFTYNAGRGWLQQVRTTRAGEVLLDQSYTRNAKGMITQITGQPGGAWQYNYDGMDRLVLANSGNTVDDRSFAYDDADNMVFNSGLCAGSATAPNLAYPTQGPGSVRPHAPVSICGTAVSYDALMLARMAQGLSARAIRSAMTWMGQAPNRPARSSTTLKTAPLPSQSVAADQWGHQLHLWSGWGADGQALARQNLHHLSR